MDKVTKTARHVIAHIRHQYGIRDDGTQAEDFAFISRGYKNAIEQLSTGLYEKEVHFILELIQNAEDNEYQNESPDLRFVVLDEDPTDTPDSDGCLCVFNNEVGFEKKHVESICQIGESTKKKIQGYIGEKGIGFKSVFIVSAVPHIYSNGYCFKFKENDPDIELSYIVPYWLGSIPRIVKEDRANTAILLPLKPGKKTDIATELKRIKSETILFLSKLEGLSVDIRSESIAIDLVRDKTHAPITDLLIQQKDKETIINRYWLHSDTVVVPEDINEEKRQGVIDRRITVAFPLESNSHTGIIYAFLPTEVDSGLPFLINADFILTANRESIQSDRPWNIWLRDVLADLVVQGLVTVSKNQEHRKSLYGFIPIAEEVKSLKEYLGPVCKEVHECLSSMEIVLADNGNLVVPSAARLATKEIRKLFGGDSKPAAFNDFTFVDVDLEKHARRLKAIGVNNFNTNDLNQCLSDVQWLSARKGNWYFDLYKFLRNLEKGSKNDLKQLSIIPIQDGRRVSSSQQQVYFPAGHRLLKKLDERLSIAYLPDIAFIDEQLSISLTENKELLAWVREHLEITDFSFSAYVGNTLVPWLYEHVDQIDEKAFLASVKIILEYWQEITEEDRNIIGEKMPVLLDTGSVIRPDNLEGVELLVPRALDKEKGWQIFLKAEEDYKHEDVLSDKYIGLIKNLEPFDEFFDVIHAQTYPDLRFYSGSRIDYKNSPHSEYVSVIFDAFHEGYTRTPELATWMTPSFFYDEAQRNNKKNRIAFLHWLEGMLENRLAHLRYGKINWFYRIERSRMVDSGLYFYLTNISWISTTKGLKRPGEVFVKTRQISEMFGNRLAYLKDDISPELCEFLGVKTEVTTETVLEYLRELSKQQEVDIKLIKQLYKYLDDYGEDYAEYFHEEALIYIPGSGKCWYISNEVIWDDTSRVLGDLYGWLSPVYATSDLRRFFLDKISISETVQNEDLARAWLQLPERNDLNPEEIEASLSKIYPRLLAEAKSLNDHPAWWNKFVDGVMLWTQDDEFVGKDGVYVPDDYYLRNLFSEDLSFVWKPENLTHNDMGALYDEFGITLLSEGVEAFLENPGKEKELESPALLTEHSKRLLCYMIYNTSLEKYEELINSGVLEKLLQSVEAETDSLIIRYDVTNSSIHKMVSNHNAFWKPTRRLLYLCKGTEYEDLLDDTVEVIARALWGAVYKKHEDHVRTTLAITTESRFKKLRDKKGWHLPPDVNKEINRLIGESGQQHLDEDSEASKEVDQKSVNKTGEEITSASDNDGIGGLVATTGQSDQTNRDVEGRKEAAHWQGRSEGRTGSGISSGATHGADANATGARPGAQGSRSRSRSRNTTDQINRQNQSRIVTYVHQQQQEHEVSDSDSQEKQAEREAIGVAAEEYVCDQEEQSGRKAIRMPKNNPGYDIESTDPETGDIRFIEVKGIDGVWGERGVGISHTQYNTACEKGESYWLYVVEHARSERRQVYRINNPAGVITEYRFDSNWSAFGVLSDVHVTPTPAKSGYEMVQELIELTDDKACQSIIAYCFENNLLVPEVGYEILDEQGKVITEIELAWPVYKLAVFVSEVAEIDVSRHKDWEFTSCDEMEGNLESLKKLLG